MTGNTLLTPGKMKFVKEDQYEAEKQEQFRRGFYSASELAATLAEPLGRLEVALAITDTLASTIPDAELAQRLRGRDEELAAAFTALVGAARQCQIVRDDEMTPYGERLKEIGGLVAARIDGIQRISEDQGRALRQIVAEGAVDDIRGLLRQGLRQVGGNRVQSKTALALEMYEAFKQPGLSNAAISNRILDYLSKKTNRSQHEEELYAHLKTEAAPGSYSRPGSFMRDTLDNEKKRQRKTGAINLTRRN